MDAARPHCWLVGLFTSLALLLATPVVHAATLRYALIGDYGTGNQAEADVAALINNWGVDFVATLGDNNYSDGASETIDANIGQFFSAYIYPYAGSYQQAPNRRNRFWPALGNHDWHSLSCVGAQCTGPYFDYFELPGNERYYDVREGDVHLFILNSDSAEPDGISSNSKQAAWLQSRLAASNAPHKHVLLHHAPYSSSAKHGSRRVAQWPFQAWGATAVFGAHDHHYERLQIGGIPYFVNGAGGRTLYPLAEPLPQTRQRYNDDFGAMLIAVDEQIARYQFINRAGTVVDEYVQDLNRGNVLVPVAASADDAEQRVSGTMVLDSSDLELTTDGSKVQTVGLRFANVPIPQGALVTNASIQFQVDEADAVGSQDTTLTIQAELSASALPFSTSRFDITNRALTDANVTWAPAPWLQRGAAGLAQQTPDLGPLIAELLSNTAWQSGSPMVFTFAGVGTRTAEAYDGDVLAAPLLQIEYLTQGATGSLLTLQNPGTQTDLQGAPVSLQLDTNAGAATPLSFTANGLPEGLDLDATTGQIDGILQTPGIYHVTVSVANATGQAQIGFTWRVANDKVLTTVLNVTSPADDAEENLATGYCSLSSSDLELGYDGAKPQLVGIRLRDVPLPRSAVVLGAYLQLQGDEPSSAPTTVTINTEYSGDAAPFSAATYDLSNRSLSSHNATWTIPAWIVGDAADAQRSPNLEQLVQELLDHPQWQAGNALSLLISGSGVRAAESFNGDASGAPALVLQYGAIGTAAVSVQIADSQDDAEQNLLSGAVSLTSSDLELGQDNGTPQIVGMRFPNLAIPPGARITDAYIKFQADETAAQQTSVLLRGEASAVPAPFSATPLNLSLRPLTANEVLWQIPSWQAGDLGEAQQTPSLATIVQEIVGRVEWQVGGSIAIFASGTGVRSAESVNGDNEGSPVLYVEYR